MNNKKSSLCFTTFVFGSYQKYIPYYIYSIGKTYPSAGIKILIKEELSPKIQLALNLLAKYDFQFEIISSNPFNFLVESYKINDSNRRTGQLARFILSEECFLGFKYGYIGDVDIIYLPEKIRLIDFHKKNLLKYNIPFSNKVRRDKDGNIVKRITGCHFIEVVPYYEKVNPILKKLNNDFDYRRDFLKGLVRDEQFLYKLLKTSFNFDDNELTLAERPIHGIHIGISRGNWDVDINIIEQNSSLSLIETKKILMEYVEDELFQNIQKLVYVKELDVIFEKLKIPRIISWKIRGAQAKIRKMKKELKKKIKNVIRK